MPARIESSIDGADMRHRPLRRLRDWLKLSQAALGETLGISQAHVSDVEAGKERLGVDPALKAKEAYPKAMTELGLTVEDLLRGRRGRAS